MPRREALQSRSAASRRSRGDGEVLLHEVAGRYHHLCGRGGEAERSHVHGRSRGACRRGVYLCERTRLEACFQVKGSSFKPPAPGAEEDMNTRANLVLATEILLTLGVTLGPVLLASAVASGYWA